MISKSIPKTEDALKHALILNSKNALTFLLLLLRLRNFVGLLQRVLGRMSLIHAKLVLKAHLQQGSSVQLKENAKAMLALSIFLSFQINVKSIRTAPNPPKNVSSEIAYLDVLGYYARMAQHASTVAVYLSINAHLIQTAAQQKPASTKNAQQNNNPVGTHSAKLHRNVYMENASELLLTNVLLFDVNQARYAKMANARKKSVNALQAVHHVLKHHLDQ